MAIFPNVFAAPFGNYGFGRLARLVYSVRIGSRVPNWSEPEQRAWDPKVSRSQHSTHATLLERIAFGGLSLSPYVRKQKSV